MRHEQSPQLFQPSVIQTWVTLRHELYEGWFVTIVHRHEGEDVDVCPSDHYGPMTGEESIQVVDAALSELLEWP